MLIRAFSRLVSNQSELKLLIVGDGPERDSLLDLITELKLYNRVEFKPFTDSHDEIIGWMKSSRVFVIPSTREGFGITALEALACGIPVVTVNDPANAIRDLIKPGTGFLCALDEQDLAEKIKTALEMGADMKEACQKSAEFFEWDRIVTEIEKLYSSLIRH
jgi:glycosyltransferase involved in cell wall biosynthesis